MNCSAKRSRDLESLLQSTKKLLLMAMAQENLLSMSMLELQRFCDKSIKAMEAMEVAVPIKAIGHKRYGSRGQTSWPLCIWELIMEQLVIGVPPTAIFRSIAGIV